LGTEFQLAVKSKQQGDKLDYHVLAWSAGRLMSEDFESLFKELSVGTMPFNPRSKGEGHPWITVGPFKRDGQGFIAIIHQEWTSRLDASGRPVAALFCLCVAERVLADYAPSYAGLSALIPGQQFFFGGDSELLGDAKISFEPLAEELPAVAAVIDETGFEFCAHVAALLLQSPVVIMQGQDLSVETRLSFLDAVASLLPYGCRADLNLSTWMSSTTDRIRISFSDVMLPKQTRVSWSAAAGDRAELCGDAARYYDYLLGIREHFGRDTGGVLAELAKERRPLSFDDTVPFVKALREIDKEYFVGKEHLEGKAQIDDIRELLRRKSSRLGREDVTKYLITLLRESPRLDDMDILRKHWDRSLWVPACEAVKGKLQFPVFQEETLRALCKFAAEHEWLDNFLDSLLEPDSEAPRAQALELFYYAFEHYPYDQKRARYLLFRSPRTLYEFLFMVGSRVQSEEQLEDIFTWLGDDDVNTNELNVYCDKLGVPRGEVSSEGILSPFRAAFGLRTDVDVTLGMIRLLAEFDGAGSDYVLKLVDIAVRKAEARHDYSIVGKLAPAVSSWLLYKLGRLPDTEKAKWQDILLTMRHLPKVSVEVDTRLDLLSLLMWRSPPSLLFEDYVSVGPEDVSAYAVQFTEQLANMNVVGQAHIESLIAYFSRMPQRTEAQIVGETYLLSKVALHIVSRDARDSMVAHVAGNVAGCDTLLTHEALSQEFRRLLRLWGAGPELVEAAVTAMWRMTRQNMPVNAILDQYVAILGLGERDFEWKVVDALNANRYLATADSVKEFIVALKERLKEHFEHEESAGEYLRDFVDALLSIETQAVNEYYRSQFASMVSRLDQLDREFRMMSKHLDDDDAHALRNRLDRMRALLPGKGFWRAMKR
jgi:hypothetical protein